MLNRMVKRCGMKNTGLKFMAVMVLAGACAAKQPAAPTMATAPAKHGLQITHKIC